METTASHPNYVSVEYQSSKLSSFTLAKSQTQRPMPEQFPFTRPPVFCSTIQRYVAPLLAGTIFLNLAR